MRLKKLAFLVQIHLEQAEEGPLRQILEDEMQLLRVDLLDDLHITLEM